MRIFLAAVFGCLALAASRGAETVPLLRPGDVFEMTVSGVAGLADEFTREFSHTYTVGAEGAVNVPLIGDVRAVGLTPTQLEKAVQAKLIEDKIFTHPTVGINMVPTARTVSVGGGVKQPQRMQWTPDLTLISAISIAGDLTDFASPKGVRLVREGKVQYYDLRKLRKNPELDPKLLPGDQVNVPQ